MKILISNSSPIPIYEQIKIAIIDQIINDDLKENELLPSIRNLASDIRISVMTVKKAYDELEKEGYISFVQGKGTFVAPKNSNLIKENVQKDIEKYLAKIISLAKRYNINKNDIFSLYNIMEDEDEASNWIKKSK